MAAYLLKQSQKLLTATAHAQITNALQCTTRSILCTKHAKSRLRSGTQHWCHRIAVEVRHATLISQDRGWGPARNTDLTGSQLRSGTQHWPPRIAVEVRHATLMSQDRGRGLARNTDLAGSRWRSGTQHWSHMLAVEEEGRRTRGGEEGGEGGRGRGGERQADIKSNNTLTWQVGKNNNPLCC